MRQNTLTILLVMVLAIPAFSQPLNRFFVEADGDTVLLGQITKSSLDQAPFQNWSTATDSMMRWSADSLALLSTPLHEKVDSIVVFLGTWCGDSRREVPQFLSLIEQMGFQEEKIKLVAVNHGLYNYKKSPEGEERGLNIHRVPTFIFYDERSNEINRLVEHPVISWQNDLLQIVTSDNYRPAYRAVSYLDSLLRLPAGLVKAKLRKETLLKSLSVTVSNEYELNTYGIKLMSSFELAKAAFVFELNKFLFPEAMASRYYLIQLNLQMGNNEVAATLLSEPEVADSEQWQPYIDSLRKILSRQVGS